MRLVKFLYFFVNVERYTAFDINSKVFIYSVQLIERFRGKWCDSAIPMKRFGLSFKRTRESLFDMDSDAIFEVNAENAKGFSLDTVNAIRLSMADEIYEDLRTIRMAYYEKHGAIYSIFPTIKHL